MRRSLALLLLVLGLLIPTCMQRPLIPRDQRGAITFARETISNPARLASDLVPFRLEQAWHLSSLRNGGYSALLAPSDHGLVAISDTGWSARFELREGQPPDYSVHKVGLRKGSRGKELRDIESATRDPATGTVWLGMEGVNAIVRTNPKLQEQARVMPQEMRHWGTNSGPEALVRLADGRFLVLQETGIAGSGGRRHEGFVFAGDPTRGARGARFEFEGPRNFAVVDMAQLPDGRVLLLMRRLVWPMPLRFAGRIVIADPGQIAAGKVWTSRQVAVLASDMPIDNFEGLAVSGEARKDGRVTVWLISDNNMMNDWQRTLLWKLSVDPAGLP